MKNKFVVLLVMLSTGAMAQEYETGKIDFSFGLGFRSSASSSLTIADYRNLFPDSELLKGDFSDYGYNDYYFNSSTMINLLWGIRIKQNNAFEQRLRLGVTYSGISPSSGSFYNETLYAYDTLTSSRTGEMTFVDSVYAENIQIPISQKQVGLDISYLIKANQNGRWCFYSGAGLEVGAIINIKADIFRSNYSYYSNTVGNYYPYDIYNNGSNSKSEVQKLDGGFYSAVYLPIGLDLRLSMKNDFWRRMHLYTEFRPTIQYSNSDLANQSVQVGMGFATFGVRGDF